MMRVGVCLFILAWSALGALVGDVRALINQNDRAGAAALVEKHQKENGITAENLAAESWLARAAVNAKDFDAAERYAAQTKKRVMAVLKTRALDADSFLPIALGAAIEVEGQVLAGRGERAQAVDYLRQELKTYHDTSIRTRIQKNINLLSLEGKTAPGLEMDEWLGPKPKALSAYQGKPVLLFFWAHWCGDCKQQAPIIGRLKKDFGPKGLVVIGPTQYYGYAEKGRTVGKAEELGYIDSVRKEHYSMLLDMPAPVSEENFRNWGGSTTPTLALIDGKGVVRLYNPGRLGYEELAAKIVPLLDDGS